MQTSVNRTARKVHLDNFHIAGFSYWDVCEAFEYLKIGTKLDLVREADNHDISKYLDMGLEGIYEVRDTRITPENHPEGQVEVIIYILAQE